MGVSRGFGGVSARHAGRLPELCDGHGVVAAGRRGGRHALLLGVRLEELVDRRVVDPGERAGRQR